MNKGDKVVCDFKVFRGYLDGRKVYTIAENIPGTVIDQRAGVLLIEFATPVEDQTSAWTWERWIRRAS